VTRFEATRAIVALAGDAPIVASLGHPAYDLFAAGERPQNFYTWGSMGLASSIGLGLALARPDVRVWVADGDGSLLMNLGALVTTAHMAPRNFVHIVLENGQYATTGGQPIPGASNVDFVGFARAAGFRHAVAFESEDEMQQGLADALRHDGPVLIDLKVSQSPPTGNRPRRGTKEALRDLTAALAARS